MSADQGNSYWSVVGRQLRKNRTAMFGFWCAVLLFFLAVCAPVLASNRPFYYSGPEGWSLPWFRDLFDRIAVPQSVDLFFNLVLVFLPFAVTTYLLLRRSLKARGRWKAKAIRRTVGGLAAVLIWIFLGVYLPDSVVSKPAARVLLAPGLALRSSKPYVDFHLRVAEVSAEGGKATAIFPPVPYNFSDTRIKENGLPPDWFNLLPDWLLSRRQEVPGAVGPHPLGTDPGGRDVFTALLYGTRISMTIGVIAVGIYVTIGIVLGSLAGYFGGKVDILISRLIEVMICFPLFFFVLTIVSVFDTRTIFLVMAAIGVTAWPTVARLVRGEFLTQRNLDYVVAAQALGVPKKRIIFRHVLPNALTPVLVSATFGIASAILTESGLSFLGLGDVNAASWGMLLNKGRQSNLEWLILAPGAAIFFTVTAFNLLGEGLRDALDPKLRR